MKAKISRQNILAKTEKSFLIKVPTKDACFWHQQRFCTLKEEDLIIWFGDEFKMQFIRPNCRPQQVLGDYFLRDILKPWLMREDTE